MNENKPTLLRTSYGNWNELAIFFGYLLGLGGIIIIFGSICMGISAIGDYYEVQAFNRIHGTDYAFGEWFWAENTIKDYHLGEVENLNVDLNIKGLKGGLE